MKCRTLIAGAGNLLLGDEGLGIHAVRALMEQGLPEGVDAVDAGTALAELLGDLARYNTLILVDAVCGGGRPGDLYRLDIHSPDDLASAASPLSLHEFGVAEALAQARALGVLPPRVVLIGMEPACLEPGIQLSQAAADAIPRLLALIRAEIASRQPSRAPLLPSSRPRARRQQTAPALWQQPGDAVGGDVGDHAARCGTGDAGPAVALVGDEEKSAGGKSERPGQLFEGRPRRTG
ncbi:MAG: hydrogenase maturation protease [Bryobacteraceae bacterium]